METPALAVLQAGFTFDALRLATLETSGGGALDLDSDGCYLNRFGEQVANGAVQIAGNCLTPTIPIAPDKIPNKFPEAVILNRRNRMVAS